MVNVFRYLKEKKEQIREYSKKRDFEDDLKRKEEIKELKEQVDILKRKDEYDKLRKTVREKKHPYLTALAKNIGKNVHEANKTKKNTNKKTNKKKKILLEPIDYSKRVTRWG